LRGHWYRWADCWTRWSARFAAFDKVVRVNLIGSLNMLRLAATEMSVLDPLEGGERGMIINTASVAAFYGQIG